MKEKRARLERTVFSSSSILALSEDVVFIAPPLIFDALSTCSAAVASRCWVSATSFFSFAPTLCTCDAFRNNYRYHLLPP